MDKASLLIDRKSLSQLTDAYMHNLRSFTTCATYANYARAHQVAVQVIIYTCLLNSIPHIFLSSVHVMSNSLLLR